MNKNYFFVFLGIAALLGLVLALSLGGSSPPQEKISAVLYKTPNCGCCGNYAAYLKRNGFSVKTVVFNDLSFIKEKYQIDNEMQSCHTVVIGDKFVEGHVPIEAVAKLIQEKNSQKGIKGIALPGMPSGSPGMPGGKTSPFRIYQLSREGWSEFMEL
jgi:hypothetical protein